jgi:hypothetical protein
MQTLKQSTADQIVYTYMADITDGFTPELAATIIPGGVYPTCYLTKNGGAPAALTLSAANFAVLDDTNMPGWYKLTLAAANTDTVGPLGIDVVKATVSRHFATACYVSASLLDDIKTNTAAILVDTGTDGVLLAATATSAKLVDDVWDEATSGHATAGTTGKALTSAQAAADPWSVDPATYATPGTYGYDIARAIGGSGNGIGTITCQDEDDVALEGVHCDVYISATVVSAATFWTGGVTNTAGVFTWYGPAGSYWVRRYKQGYGFASDPVAVTIREMPVTE